MKNPLSSILNFFKNNKQPAQFSLDIDKLDNCILLAMLYISRNTTESGKYVYRSNTDVQTRYSDKQYSSLRHAGTLYSMYLCETLLGNTAIQNKRFAASEYFIKNYVKRVNSDMYGVVSKPFEEAPVLLATSGGTGLGLIALSNLLEENRISKTILQKMGNFLLFMQNEFGDFWPSYEFGTKTRSKLHAARYYPGEACLGLLYLYDTDKDEKWLNAAKKGILRLAELGAAIPAEKLKFDHWGLLAIQKLYSLPEIELTTAQKLLISAYLEKNSLLVIENQNLDSDAENYGSYKSIRSLCGNATIMEGLIAAYHTVPSNVLKTRILNSVSAGIEFLAKYQVKDGSREGGIPGTYKWNNFDAVKSDKEIRIDNVQHALSAFAAYKLILKNILDKNSGK